MTINLNSLADWSPWEEGKGLPLEGDPRTPRRIRLDVNCAQPTHFAVSGVNEHRGENMFLAVIHGLDTLDFVAVGDIVIRATSDDQVWFYTAALDPTWIELPDSESYATIASRRARNPELEYMQWKMDQNIAARFAALDQKYANRFGVNTNPRTGEVHDDDEAGNADDSGAAGRDTGEAEGEAAPSAKKAPKGPKPGGDVPAADGGPSD